MGAWFKDDRGAALVTVLLIIMVMSAGVMLTLDTLTYTIRRSVAVQVYSQAKLYARGGEQMAQEAAEQLYNTDQAIKAVLGTGDEAAVSFPLDQGGYIKGYLRDASNCFNINSLVTAPERGLYISNEENILYFQRLLVNLGMSAGQSTTLSSALVDWLDSDSRPSRGGAEDYDYSGLKIPYRAANSLMADITELRLVQGFTPEVLGVLEAYVCAVPEAAENLLNVNTLTVDHAPILAALVGEGLSVNDAARLIAERPGRGYSDIGSFWAETAFEGITIPQAVRSKADVWPRLFFAEISVKYIDADVKLTSLMQMENDGSSKIISRRYGALF